MEKQRLDQAMATRGMVASRSQAESYIRLGKVLVNGKPATKTGQVVDESTDIVLQVRDGEQYVSRAALKLQSVVKVLKLDFRDKIVLDIGSSTGGFTQFALKRGARKVVAVEVGKDQLHPSLRTEPKIELYEQTDIRHVYSQRDNQHEGQIQIEVPDVVVADVSFISLREILPHVVTLCNTKTDIAVMVKPQFEASQTALKHKGVIKNDKIRREILRDFEQWARGQFVIIDKADSDVAGAKGNLERFYLLRISR
jgi:23S rRNA (cytidine1920-2'-O)/16S rRNA (cytidine1409-2'-O)-methyltransferase